MNLDELKAKNKFQQIVNRLDWLHNHGFITENEKVEITMWAQKEIIDMTRPSIKF